MHLKEGKGDKEIEVVEREREKEEYNNETVDESLRTQKG